MGKKITAMFGILDGGEDHPYPPDRQFSCEASCKKRGNGRLRYVSAHYFLGTGRNKHQDFGGQANWDSAQCWRHWPDPLGKNRLYAFMSWRRPP